MISYYHYFFVLPKKVTKNARLTKIYLNFSFVR